MNWDKIMNKLYSIENKLSFDNYIYYKLILKKARKQTIIWYITELLYLYCIGITEPNITGNIFLLPVFILVIIKDAVFIAGKKNNRTIISVIINFIAFFLMIAETCLFSGPAGIIDVFIINCSIVFPVVFSIITFRNDLITESLSEISDYPYFRYDFYKATDEHPYEPFDNSKKDILLVKSLEQFQTNRYVNALKIIVLGVSAVSIMFMIFFSFELMQIRNAKNYNPGTYYSPGEYISMNVSSYAGGEHYVNFFGKKTVSYWCKSNDMYIYVTSSVKNFNKIKKATELQRIKIKTQKFESDNIDLFKDIIYKENGECSEYNLENSISNLQIKCEKNVSFKILDTEKTEDRIWRYLIFFLIGIILYIITSLLFSNKKY